MRIGDDRRRNGKNRVVRRLLLPVSTLTILAVVVMACSAPVVRGPAPSPRPEPLAEGLPEFYGRLPTTPDVEPGTIIALEPVSYQRLPNPAWRVAYSSRSVDGRAIAVTGLVILPMGTPPPGGWPIVSWAHATTGLGDRCAPSTDLERMLPARGFISTGHAFVATDYEGMGTVGGHPYLVGVSEGRAVLDIALAATRIPEWNTSDQVAVWGHSQGGHAALFAMHMADSVAPELEVVAVVAGAPPSGFESFGGTGTHQENSRVPSILLAAAYSALDPLSLPLDGALAEEGVRIARTSTQSCSAEVRAAIDALPANTPLILNPPSDAWVERLRENDPQTFASTSIVPTLIIHGTGDEVIPVAASIRVHQRLCQLGQDSELWVVSGTDHSSVVSATFPAMLQWIDGHFGRPTGVERPPSVAAADCR